MRRLQSISTFSVAGLLIGALTGAAGIALAQDSPGLDPDAALAIREAQVTAKEAELAEREARLTELEASKPCDFDPLLSVNYGPPVPDDVSPQAVTGVDTVAAAGAELTDSVEDASDLEPEKSAAANAAEVAQTLKAMKPKKAARVVVELDSHLAARAMTELSARNRARILDHVPPAAAAAITAALGEKP